MLQFLELVHIALSVLILSISLVFIKNKKINAAILYYPIFFFFFPLHDLLNFFVGYPIFPKKLSLIQRALTDENTLYYYFTIMWLLNSLFLIFILKKRASISLSFMVDYAFMLNEIIRPFKFLLFAISFFGPISIIFTNNPEVYLYYGEIRDFIDTDFYETHSFVVLATNFSIMAIVLLRMSLGKNISSLMAILFFLVLILDVYFNNKRFVFIFFILYFIVSYYFSSIRFKFIIYILFPVICSTSMYVYYAKNIKYSEEQTTEEVYAALRHELSREDVLKFTIYKRLVLNENILEFDGEGFLSIVTAFIPRSFYYNKPYPYSQYITESILYNRVGPALYGWTITNGFYDEFIGNFSFSGILLLFIFLSLAIFFIDKEKNIQIKILMFLLLVFYTMTNVSWYIELVYLLLFMIILDRIKQVLIKV